MRIRICHVFRTNPRERIFHMEEKNFAKAEERFALNKEAQPFQALFKSQLACFWLFLSRLSIDV